MSMAKIIFLICILLNISVFLSKGASPASPYAYTKSSDPNGARHVFVMYPQDPDSIKGKGYCLTLSDRGNLDKTWDCEGWYEFPGDVFLCPDGECLLRINSVTLNDSKNINVPIITFYRKGQVKNVISFNNIYINKNPSDTPVNKLGIKLEMFRLVAFIKKNEFIQRLSSLQEIIKEDNEFLQLANDNKLDWLAIVITWDMEMICFNPLTGNRIATFNKTIFDSLPKPLDWQVRIQN